MDESAEMSACLELLRLGVMALHGETLGQRATINGAVREAVGRSALISATLTPLCSPQVLACLLSCMCANVWRVSGVLMRWIWLVASTDAMDALGVAPAVRTWQLFAPGSCSPSCQENACPLSAAAAARAPQLSTSGSPRSRGGRRDREADIEKNGARSTFSRGPVWWHRWHVAAASGGG